MYNIKLKTDEERMADAIGQAKRNFRMLDVANPEDRMRTRTAYVHNAAFTMDGMEMTAEFVNGKFTRFMGRNKTPY